MPKGSILFLVPYPYDTAPSQRLKFEQYYSEIRTNGYQISTSSFFDYKFWAIVYKKKHFTIKFFYTLKAYLNRYLLLFKISKYSIVYIHLWGTPLGPPIYEWVLRKLCKKMVYDIDDLIYEKSTSPANKFIRIFKSPLKVNYLMSNANKVLVSTEKLLKYASEYTSKTTFIPATIDVKNYENLKEHYGLVTLGWSGSHTTSKYLLLIKNVLQQLAQSLDFKLLVMGDPDFYIEGVNFENLKWSSAEEADNICLFDIGLHPLLDEEWVYGKSGGKLVQYMAAGIPIVASAVGPNYLAVKEGYNGFLANNELDWHNHLYELITNHNLRRIMGRHSRIRAEEVYSVEANLHKYLDVLNAL